VSLMAHVVPVGTVVVTAGRPASTTSKRVEVFANQTSGVTLNLLPGLRVVRGRVTRPDGWPLGSAEVEVSDCVTHPCTTTLEEQVKQTAETRAGR
jgi:hypothetical protein